MMRENAACAGDEASASQPSLRAMPAAAAAYPSLPAAVAAVFRQPAATLPDPTLSTICRRRSLFAALQYAYAALLLMMRQTERTAPRCAEARAAASCQHQQ